MKQKKTSLTINPLIDFGEMVCKEISCKECPQRGNCDIWEYQPEVYKNLAKWYLGKVGYFKVAK